MCGIGTTVVEALHQNRRAIGVEYETRWAEIARANIQHTGPFAAGSGGSTPGTRDTWTGCCPPSYMTMLRGW